MPTFKIIEGVKIECFSGDHPPPHVHASIAEHEALMDLRTFKILRGSLPGNKIGAVIEFIKESKDDLAALFMELNPHLRSNENK